MFVKSNKSATCGHHVNNLGILVSHANSKNKLNKPDEATWIGGEMSLRKLKHVQWPLFLDILCFDTRDMSFSQQEQNKCIVTVSPV